MHFNAYQALASRTINRSRSLKETNYHALFGMAAEVGELHSIWQKVYQGHEFDPEHAKLELGDLLWFIAEYCTANGLTLEDVAWSNLKKLEERYPNGFEEEKSQHRREGDI